MGDFSLDIQAGQPAASGSIGIDTNGVFEIHKNA